MNVSRQIRKAIADISATLPPLVDCEAPESAWLAQKARYQLDLLGVMASQPAERRQPWSYYQPQVEEEFGPAPGESGISDAGHGRDPRGVATSQVVVVPAALNGVKIKRTFLAASLPDLTNARAVVMEVVYLLDDPSVHPRLRLRRRGVTFELTKKAPST
jgi:hypothetical protein